MKIALLASSTATGLGKALGTTARAAGLDVEIWLGPYNQVAQQVLDARSDLYAFSPALVILWLEARALLGERYFRPYAEDVEERKRWVERTLAELQSFVEAVKAQSSAKILLHNLAVPFYSPLGILETKQAFGFFESVRAVNHGLAEAYREDPRVLLFDYDGFCSRVGKLRISDPKLYYLADIELDLKHVNQLAAEYVGYLNALSGRAKKCVVVDLDDTLWGGVVAEEGLSGIRLGPTPEGRPYLEFQKHLLALFERGILLAVNSRNNPEDVYPVLREHPHMVLREEHFAAIRINWEDKASNLRSIAHELNLSTDALAFIDEDPFQRELVRSLLPEVFVLELPADPALFPTALMAVSEFNSLQLTREDRERGEMYARERDRRALKATVGGYLESYLRALETVVSFEPPSTVNIPRISQLTQKTNQFNMTTRRYGEEEIRGLAETASVVGVRAKDRFGDNGLVGVLILKPEEHSCAIDTFLLSCRVLGRGIEEQMLSHVEELARQRGARLVRGEVVPTPKNVPARGFYEKSGFRLVNRNEGRELWEKSLR